MFDWRPLLQEIQRIATNFLKDLPPLPNSKSGTYVECLVAAVKLSVLVRVLVVFVTVQLPDAELVTSMQVAAAQACVVA